jgi:hypothetical protein
MRLPSGWAEDPLSDFMNAAFANTLATFVHKRNAFSHLLKIDGTFRSIEATLNDADTLLVVALLHRSHSAFLASCRSAMSGQVVDTFPLLRSCLEYALYTLHINVNPELAAVWSRRHENEDSLREMKRRFQYARVMETLLKCDTSLHSALSTLYDRTIDFGGHPNERALSISITMRVEGDERIMRNQFLHGESLALNYVIKTTAQVGLGSLMVLRPVFQERVDLAGLRDTINALGGLA